MAINGVQASPPEQMANWVREVEAVLESQRRQIEALQTQVRN